MTQHPNFSPHPASALHTPDVPGMRVLLDCLHAGRGFMAQPTGPSPVTADDANRQWVLCATSGTSGKPKVIRRSPLSWIRSFGVTFETYGIDASHRYATFGSLGHSLTLYASVEAICLGADQWALGPRAPKAQAQAVATHGITVIYATPTQLGLLVKGAAQAQIAGFPALTYVFCGGGALADTVRVALQRLCPQAQIIVFFGASETSFITLTQAKTPHGSVGRAYPHVELRVDAPCGEVGEIWVKSPYLFAGYAAGDHSDTRWDVGFLSIGEMGWLDAAQNLFLKGRKNRMVTVADVNVFPEDIETCVVQMDHVQACAVVAVPDDRRGNRLICFVQSDEAGPTAPQVQAHCRAVLGAHQVPKEVRRIARLPLLEAGKPDLVKLRALALGA
ncbi:long-chain acyl-CoA synthetase [Yoonia tamlensis]|uniref:Long-chain acyl-CoA synthetase n=1 Tax=Yoonia tamlensis TaxID=390270 RepID=A0A1I6HRA5_9RHOB|nr:AMP-binding protein [Yoonia tamlensis]SFR56992.1 long-chain acyl-CoA synthetase [Yoonia tamlensis]